jgi:hypothetical protein
MLNVRTDHLGGMSRHLSLPVAGLLNIGTDLFGGLSQHLKLPVAGMLTVGTNYLCGISQHQVYQSLACRMLERTIFVVSAST